MEGYIGQVIMFAGSRIPNEWMICDGATLDINHHEALYSIIGNTYGGDYGHTFKLPKIEPIGEVKYIICINGIYPDFY